MVRQATRWFALLLAGCVVELELPSTAEIDCAGPTDCPQGFACVGEPGRCASVDSPCVDRLDSEYAPAPDGRACELSDGEGDGVCHGGVCSPASCGDGIVDAPAGEECDDGNTVPYDGCSHTCLLPFCGDGHIDIESEQCDGDDVAGGLCTDSCVVACELGRGDCNGSLADGCECQPQALSTLSLGSIFISEAKLLASADALFIANVSTLCRLAKTGGTPDCVAVAADELIQDIAVDEQHVYVAADTLGGADRVLRLDHDLTAPQDVLSDLDEVEAITVDATSIYLAFFIDDVVAYAKTGGPATVLASGLYPRRLVVGGSDLYVASLSDISRVPLAGGAVETLVEDQDDITGLGVDGSHVYWTDAGPPSDSTKATDFEADARLWRRPLQGGEAQALGPALQAPSALALGEDAVIVGDAASHAILEVQKADGRSRLFVSSESEPSGVTTDAEYVYWIEALRVWRAPR